MLLGPYNPYENSKTQWQALDEAECLASKDSFPGFKENHVYCNKGQDSESHLCCTLITADVSLPPKKTSLLVLRALRVTVFVW